MRVLVQEAPFDLGQESADFARGHRDMGAIVTFTGVVRDLPDDPLEACMTLMAARGFRHLPVFAHSTRQ